MTPTAPGQGDHFGRSPDFAGHRVNRAFPGLSPVACAGHARRLQLRGQSWIYTTFPFHRTHGSARTEASHGYALGLSRARGAGDASGSETEMPQDWGEAGAGEG